PGNRESLPADRKRSLCPVKLQGRGALRASARLTMGPDGGERLSGRVATVEDGILRVRSLPIVIEHKPVSNARDTLELAAQHPVNDIERMMPEICHLSAGRVPEPAEVIDPALRVVRSHRGRAEEHGPVELLRRLAVRWLPEPGHDVPVRTHPHGVD